MRHHYAHRPVSVIRPVVKQNTNFKPKGFWFEVDGGWREWCSSEMPEWTQDGFLYRLDLGEERLLKIDSVKMLDGFTEEYGVMPSYGRSRHDVHIDWARVAEDFDGIEIAPYRSERRFDYLWYYGWDCASGCLWRPHGARLTLEQETVQ